MPRTITDVGLLLQLLLCASQARMRWSAARIAQRLLQNNDYRILPLLLLMLPKPLFCSGDASEGAREPPG